MAMNSAYQAGLDAESGKFTGESQFEKLPAVKPKEIGDALKGRIVEVSDVKTRKTKDDNGNDRDEQYQVVTMENIVLKFTEMTDDGPVKKTEKVEKGQLWLNKNGQFAAAGRAVSEHDGSDLKEFVGFDLLYKRVTNGEPKQLRNGKMGSPPHRFDMKLVKA